jgi:hypothetical protein
MSNEQRIEYEILNYLSKQPAAKDTFQGIAEWWVLKQRIDDAVERVSGALDMLISKEFIIIKQNRDGGKFFQVNEAKSKEIKSTLSQIAPAKSRR